MSATAAPALSDRSDFRTVTVGGAKIGLITALATGAYLLVARQVSAPLPQRILELLIVLATGVAATFLPARWTAARGTDGVAGCAAMGLVGTVVFSAVDIVVLRPLKAYPWTWDAVGGNSTWWYLPIWWMLGTSLAWLGGIVTARLAVRGEATLARSALPALVGAVGLGTVAPLAGLPIPLSVGAGAGFFITLAVVAVVALARKS